MKLKLVYADTGAPCEALSLVSWGESGQREVFTDRSTAEAFADRKRDAGADPVEVEWIVIDCEAGE